MIIKELNTSNGKISNSSNFNEIVNEINNYHFAGKRVDEPEESIEMITNKKRPFIDGYNDPRYFDCRKVVDNLTGHTLQWTLPINGKEIFDKVLSYLRHYNRNFRIQTSDACNLTIDFHFAFNLPLVCYPGHIRIKRIDDLSSILILEYKFDDSVCDTFEVGFEFMVKDVQSELEKIGRHFIWEVKSKIENDLKNLFSDSGIAVAFGQGLSNRGFEIIDGFDYCTTMTNEQKNRLIDLVHSSKFIRIVSIRLHTYDNIEILGQTVEEVKKELFSTIVNKKMSLRELVRDIFPDMRYFPIYVDDEAYDVSLYLYLQKKAKNQQEYPLCYNMRKLRAELKKHKSIKALKMRLGDVEIIE